ncbi:MAG: TIGR02757 family protein [Prevotella sp.]
MTMDDIKSRLVSYARKYETADFLLSDPSLFMHKVTGKANQETLAFIASCLSYGSRKQFFPKIQFILDCSEGNTFDWIAKGTFRKYIPDDDDKCFYRLYTYHTIRHLLEALQELIQHYSSLESFISRHADTGFAAVSAICSFFADKGIEGVIPKNTSSACKRVCMFLRWMVRDNSPVDLGLWKNHIDKRTLIMPLDTHVLQESCKLGLLSSKTASMSAAIKLTRRMLEIFPEDPLKGDFALFGYGVDESK